MSHILDDLKSVLHSTPLRWINLASYFQPSDLRKQPLAGEWSALEALQHLIDTEKHVFPTRVHAVLKGEDFVPFNTDSLVLSDDRTAMEMAMEFQALRSDSLLLVEALSLSDLSKSVEHPMMGTITLSHLLHEWGGHDLMHIIQAEEALMQKFIAGCGAFEVYFEEHKAIQS